MQPMLRGARRAIVVACALLPMSTTAAVITVTPATFDAAVAAAKGGDTLKLVGTFGKERIMARSFIGGVTLDATQATFTATLTLKDVENLTVVGGTFNIVGAVQYTRAVAIYGGRNVTFKAPRVLGSAGGEGIVFDGTNGANVAGGMFHGLENGVVLGSVTNGNVSKATITGAVSDGIDIADSHNVTASYNSCSAGAPGAGVHPDCIQLWSVTGKPLQSDIVVRNNSASGPTQGFTAFASMGGELRVQFSHNKVDTSYAQGIACYDCLDSNISYNSLSTLVGAPFRTNLNVVGGSGNLVVGNLIEPYVTLRGPASATFEDDGATGAMPDLAALVGTAPDGGGSAVVPEPASWTLLVAGFAVVGTATRRRRPIIA